MILREELKNKFYLLCLLCIAIFFSMSGAFAQQEGETPDINRITFDLYLSDKFMGAVLVTYGEDWFKVDQTDDIFDQTKDVIKKQELIDLVSGQGPLTRHVDGVGTVTLDVNTFRLVLNIDPKYLTPESQTINSAAPTLSGFSILNSFDLQYSVDNKERDYTALSYNLLGGYGRLGLRGNVTGLQNGGYEVTDAAASYTYSNLTLSSGLLQTPGQIFASSVNHLGARLATEERTYVELDKLQGSKLQVFIPSRSKVEVFRSNRLIYANNLDFGLQEIDTTSFPQGSYEVDIIITADSGAVTRDRRFYTKSGLLGVRGYPNFKLEGGKLRDQLGTENVQVWSGEASWRPFGPIQISASNSGINNTNLSTAGLTAIIGDNSWIQTTYGSSNNRDRAVSGTIALQFWDMSIFGSAMKALSGFDRVLTPDEIANLPTVDSQVQDNRFRRRRIPITEQNFLTNQQKSYSGGASWRISPFELRYSMVENDIANSFKRKSHGPRIIWDIIRNNNITTSLQLDSQKTESGDRQEVYLLFEKRFGQASIGASTRYRKLGEEGDFKGGEGLRTNVFYNKDARGVSGLGDRLKLSADVLNDNTQGSKDLTELSADTFHRNTLVEFDGRHRAIYDKDQDKYNSVGSIKTSAALLEKGTFKVLSPIQTESALIVEVKGVSDSDSKIFTEVLVDGIVQAKLAMGDKIVLPVEPFRNHTVSIRPDASSLLIKYQSDARKFLVFPGNIKFESWSIEPATVVLGELVNDEGEPLSWERVKGSDNYIITEENGAFQAELTGNEKLSIHSSRINCDVNLPEIDITKEVNNLGKIVCKSSNSIKENLIIQ